MPPRLEIPLREEAIVFRLATKLLGKKSDLEARIVRRLLGRPRRYGDLKPLLGGKGDHNLTVALKRLRADGILDQRVDARRTPPIYTYEITGRGVEVALMMHSIQLLGARLDALASGGAAR